MKYVYLAIFSIVIFWETDSFQQIYEFHNYWQYLANIVLVGYFAFLLEISIPVKKIFNLGSTKTNI
ncbi:hypothetical protein GH741_01195 [Aquibacillus halophilus]|uniref:Uncharacterized protein n=1 Tax=Aquibacillus halophilus TaxID=930132 RepID=A0A6A8D9R9_9BACI|nr:hypothetical protein [Aquibacillus halophilus]MRH41286.1 hypothetical protein [Aquibacillus halophilus]